MSDQQISKRFSHYACSLIVAVATYNHAERAYAQASQSPQSEAEYQRLVKEADTCLKARKFQKSAIAATAALKIHQTRSLFTTRAACYFFLRRKELAIQDYTSALKIKESVEVYLARSGEYKDLGNLKAARADLESAMRLEPTGRIAYKLADLELEYRDIDAAKKSAEKALQLLAKEPDSPARDSVTGGCYEKLAQIYLAKNQLPKALECITKTLAEWDKASPAKRTQMASYMNKIVLMRGEIYEKMGKLDDAIKEYELVVNLMPKSFEFRRSLLRAYRKANQTEKALALVTQLLNEDDSPDLYYKRAEIYKKLGKDALAQRDIDRAKKGEFSLMGNPAEP